MLSSRYLHLHEALGLGPMWLAQGARISKSEPSEALPSARTAMSRAAQQIPTPAEPERTLSSSGYQARMAALASINQPHKPQDKAAVPLEKTTPPEKAAVSTDPAIITAPQIPSTPIEVNVPLAQVMVASICPAPEDMLHGALFSGEVGVLLRNMLAAIGLNDNNTHKTSWIQDAPSFSPKPEMAMIQANLARIQAELHACQAHAVVLLGNIFEQPELTPMIDALCGDIPHFILPHPARLLRQPQLKAQAWRELKKLRTLLQQGT